jgi:hypothetical protein
MRKTTIQVGSGSQRNNTLGKIENDATTRIPNNRKAEVNRAMLLMDIASPMRISYPPARFL